MKKISVYSLIIGIGFGIIITSIFNIMSIQFKDSYFKDEGSIFQESSDKYGNVNHKQGVSMDSTDDPNNRNKLGLDSSINEDINDEIFSEIFINKGMNSKEIANLLETNGIIESQEQFNELAAKLKMTRDFKYGLKIIPVHSSLEEILLILTKN